MNAEKLVEHCFDNDVELFLENGNLKARGNETMIQELATMLKERKADLIQYLEYINKQPSEPYQEEPLTRYFTAEGWSYESAIKLAKGMIDRNSFLPAHEHEKYMKLVSES